MGGSSNKAQAQAQQAEKQRQAQVSATQQRIESIYDSPARESQIADLIGATRDFLGKDLDRQNATGTRQLKFALARNGQSGGSTDVDQNRDLGKNYLRGALEVERRAQGAGSSLRSADQQAKQQLFAQASSGLDITTAARQAGESMRASAGTARADALQSGLGDVFGDFSTIYKQSLDRAQQRKNDQSLGAYTPGAYGPYSGAYRYGGQDWRG